MRLSPILHSLLVLVLCLSVSRPAHAVSGIAVRLSAGETSLPEPIVVEFTGEGQETASVALQDDGEAPDVFADDDLYTGSGMLADGPFTITVIAGDQSWDGGEVSWTTTEGPRDLDLVLDEEGLSAKTSQSDAPGQGGPAPTRNARPTDRSPTDRSPTGQASTPPSSPTAEETDDSSFLFIGAGLLLLAALGAIWLRGGHADDETEIRGLQVIAPPGLWGEGTATALDGLACWHVAKDDKEDFVGALVERLAPHYRVLVIGEHAVPLPSVHGGPVYQGKAKGALHAGDLAEDVLALSPRRLVVILVDVPDNGDDVVEYRDMLPRSLCCAALTSTPIDGFTNMSVSRSGEDWVVTPAGSTEANA